MIGRRALWLAAAASLLVAGFPLPAQASALYLVVVSDRTSGLPGDIANITIYSFVDGQAAALERPPTLTVGDLVGGGRELPVTMSAPGRYGAVYTFLSADLSWDWIELRASASFGLSGEDRRAVTETLYLWMQERYSGPEDPSYKFTAGIVEASASPIAEGSRVSFLCLASRGGAPADPPGLNFSIERENVPGTEVKDPAAGVRQGPGRYIVNYTIPPQRHDGRFALVASFGPGPDQTSTLYTGASARLDHYCVLYHELSRNGSRVDFELLVSDRKGAPVNGSEVEMRASQQYPSGKSLTLTLGRTDRKGRVKGILDPGPDGGYLQISGWANTSRRSQRFSGSLSFPGSPWWTYWPAYGLEAWELARDVEPVPGATVNVTYEVLYAGIPLAERSVDCYIVISGYDRFGENRPVLRVSGERLRTDGQGLLNLSISFPEARSTIAEMQFVFPGLFPEGPYSHSTTSAVYALLPGEAVPADPWKPKLNLSRAEAGKAFRAEASVSGQELMDGSAYLGSVQDLGNGTWDVWNSFRWPLLQVPDAPGRLSGAITLPRHLKAGTRAVLEVGADNLTGWHERSEANVTLAAAGAAAEDGSDLCCLLGAAAMNIALIVFLMISYSASRKAPARRDMENMSVDERLAELAGPPGAGRGPDLPESLVLERSEPCGSCGRPAARGVTALACSCGKVYHEHCAGGLRKCPGCGKDWTDR